MSEKDMRALKKRILCVNSELLHLKLFEDILNAEGYEVAKAEDGRAALDYLHKQGADLVILDSSQLQMSGLQVCRDIKEDKRYRNIPVIMIISLGLTQDRVRAARAGADDFIIKPFHIGDVASKVRAQLKIRELQELLHVADSTIDTMASFHKETIRAAASLYPDIFASLDALVRKVFVRRETSGDGPQIVLVGILDDSRRRWFYYAYKEKALKRTLLAIDVGWNLTLPHEGGERIFCNSEDEIDFSLYKPLIQELASMDIAVSTIAGYMSRDLSVVGMNYGRKVTLYDAQAMQCLATQEMFLITLSRRIMDSDDALAHLVHSLVKMSESGVQDSGAHVVRIGEYACLLAQQLGMDEKFVRTIKLQSQLHDIGNIHIPAVILQKPARLTDDEFREVKNHTLYGAQMVGEHKGFQMARNIALTHHERWDGSGYPYGMKESKIPVEGRLMNIVDQYDSLRRTKTYRPSFDHDTACRIILEGDGRTMPHHFDPQILRAFREAALQVQEVHEKFSD